MYKYIYIYIYMYVFMDIYIHVEDLIFVFCTTKFVKMYNFL